MGATATIESYINHAATAYVEVSGNDAAGALGLPSRSFATINAACTALPSTGGIIHVGIGTFAAWTNPTKSYVTLRGSGRPGYKSDFTALVGGTIITGPFLVDTQTNSVEHIKFYDLGFDSGSAVCTSLYSGVAQECFQIGNRTFTATVPYRHGIEIHNCAFIAQSPTALVHCCDVENVIGARCSSITTLYGTHGFVYKGLYNQLSDLDANQHQTDGLIFKSDTHDYTACCQASNILIHNSDVTGLVTGPTACGGLIIQAENGTVIDDIVVTGLQVYGCSRSVVFMSDTGSTVVRGIVNGFNDSNLNYIGRNGPGTYTGNTVNGTGY